MSLDARPNPLRVLADRKALWLAVPAIALLAGLVMIGSRSVTSPKAVAQAQPAVAEAATAVPPKVETPVAFSTEQKQELEKIIKNYLVSNPEVFLEAQTALEAKMEKEQAEKLKVAIAENAREIYRDPPPTLPAIPTATSPSLSSSITTAATASAVCTMSSSLWKATPRCASSSRSCRSCRRVRRKLHASPSPLASRANTGTCTRPCSRRRAR